MHSVRLWLNPRGAICTPGGGSIPGGKAATSGTSIVNCHLPALIGRSTAMAALSRVMVAVNANVGILILPISLPTLTNDSIQTHARLDLPFSPGPQPN
jgi:hypothetical protein